MSLIKISDKWRIILILCAVLAISTVTGAETVLRESGTISATASVTLPLGLVSSCDTCVSTLPPVSSFTSHSGTSAPSSEWLLRVNSLDGMILNINGTSCDFSRLPATESSYVRFFDPGVYSCDQQLSGDSLVITLMRCDD